MTRIVALLILFITILNPSSMFAQELSDESKNCIRCHGAEAENEAQNTRKIQGDELTIDTVKYLRSNHANLDCSGCHIDGYDSYPHIQDTPVQNFSCLDCHFSDPDIDPYKFAVKEQEFKKSAHFQLHGDKFSCNSCHNVHEFKAIKHGTDISTRIESNNSTCFSCHLEPEKFASIANREYVDVYYSHEWLPNLDLHWSFIRCIDCHTSPSDRSAHNILFAYESQRECIGCHSANSILIDKLYRYRADDERQKYGFMNSIALNNAYIIGMTRNIYLDSISVILFAVVLTGIAIHGIARVVFSKKKPALEKQAFQYSPWLRNWHWINVKLFLLLIISGLSLHFAGSGIQILPFNIARLVHNYSGIALCIVYVLFIIYNFASGNWKQYIPGSQDLSKGNLKQLRYYFFGIFRGEQEPYPTDENRKFNPFQKTVYFASLFFLTPVFLISGLLLLFPEFAPETVFGFGGILPMAMIHIISSYLVSVFMFVHIYVSSTGMSGFTQCRAMFNIKKADETK